MKESKSELLQALIANLTRTMKARGISQTQLAHDAGISQGTISLILSEKRDVTLGVVEKLAKSLEVSHEDLLRMPHLRAVGTKNER